MSRQFVLVGACAAALLATPASAQPVPDAPLRPPAADPAVVPVAEPGPAATAVPGPADGGSPPPAGVTADTIAAMPRLPPIARAEMRAACEAGLPTCDRLALLGRLERAALIRALRRRGLVIDPAPAGKRVGQIRVVTLAPFGQDESWLGWANTFHVNSKASVIAREVLVSPGDPWDQDAVEESQRKLRDPLFATVAIIVAVRPIGAAADDAGAVDLLVVNRDIFSLRMNSNFEVQQGQLTSLALSLSENNFLGRRKLLAFTFNLDQASLAMGPLYIDKNLLGRRLDFRVRGGPILERASGDVEGSEAVVSLAQPLWSLKSKWSWRLDASRGNTVERSFRGTSLRTFDAEVTPEDDLVPWRYRLRRWTVGGGVVRAWGGRYARRLTVGYDLSSRRPLIQDDVIAAPAVLAEFEREVLPRSERAGVASMSFEVFTPRYRDYVDIDSFDLAEDVRLGPRVEVGLGLASAVFGSENTFGRLSIEAGWTAAWAGDGLASVAASAVTRVESGRAIDRSTGASLRVVSPATRLGRVVAELRLSGLFREEANRFYTVGGDNGLRGYAVGAFAGERRAVAQVEARTRSTRLWLGVRAGLVAFYDVGDAADTVGALGLKHDLGLGVRSLTPQLSREVFRLDVAVPLSGADRGRPRLILGYRQAF